MRYRFPGVLLALLLVCGGCPPRTAKQSDQGPPVWPDFRGKDATGEGLADRGAGEDAHPTEARQTDVEAGLTDADTGIRESGIDQGLPAPGWQKLSVPATQDLHDVSCVQGHVFAVGNGGTVIHRGSSGATTFARQVVDAASPPDLYAVSFADATLGVIGGRSTELYQTTDLGATPWKTATQCKAYEFDVFYGIHLGSATEGFAVGMATTGDAGHKYFEGMSWVCNTTYPGETFYDVVRRGKYGWIVGDTSGKIYRTEDGMNWSAAPLPSSQPLRAIQVSPNLLHGVTVGKGGAILRTEDAKGSWSTVPSPTKADLWDVFFWDQQRGWAVGSAGTILASVDGGKSWTVQLSGSTRRLEGVCFISLFEGFAVGEQGTVLYTLSGGR